jgi:protein-disulfide isomerase
MALPFSLMAEPVGAQGDPNEKLIKYYRKKMDVPPTTAVTVKDSKDSPLGGAKQGTLQVGTPPRVQMVTFTSSADGRYVIFGEVDDVTVDPSKAVMAKIDLKDEPFKGPADATVTIVEYSDFQCPFCAKGYTTIEKEVLPAYPGKVKFY